MMKTMHKQLWDYIFSRYPATEEITIDKETLYRIVEDVYSLAYDDGYGNGHDDGYNYCCEIHGLEPDG